MFKIRVYPVNSKPMIDVYINCPSGRVLTNADTNSYSITLSNIKTITPGFTNSLWNLIKSYDSANPLIVTDIPEGVNSNNISEIDLFKNLYNLNNLAFAHYDTNVVDLPIKHAAYQRTNVIDIQTNRNSKVLRIFPAAPDQYGDLSLLIMGRYFMFLVTSFINKNKVSSSTYITVLNETQRSEYVFENLYFYQIAEDSSYLDIKFPSWDTATIFAHCNVNYDFCMYEYISPEST